jgi:hypothetical protein
MYNYVYNTKKQYKYNLNIIISLQKIWRKKKFNEAFKTKNFILGNYILKKILNLESDINYCKYLFIDIKKNICKYDTEIIRILQIYKNNIINSINYLKYNPYQLKQNIEKYIFIMLINKTLKEFNKFYLKIDELEDLKNQYTNIYNSDIDNKCNFLKKILNQHIIKTEKIINKYKCLGCDLIKKNIDCIKCDAYKKIYNEFLLSKNINNKKIDHKKYYNILNCFLTKNNIQIYLFYNDKEINVVYDFKNLVDNLYYIVKSI